MAKRREEATTAELLSAWTDSDTAMQIVGTSLGVFGAGSLDPEIVLASETPLRNALFDVLLSLAEGGALDMRPSGDGYYAFRWRADYALGALSSDHATTIDIDAPSPYLIELADARRERDEAVARAEAAEAVLADLERALRPVGASAAADPASPPFFDQDVEGDDDDFEGDEPDVVDLAAAERAEVVYMTPPPRKRPTRKELDERLAHALDSQRLPQPVATAAAAAAAAAEDESDELRSHNSKWSAYALDTPGGPLAPVERLAHEG
jgi:hypothetical protein